METASIDRGEVLDLLSRLVDKSLVLYEESGQGNTRYGLLESVRQYAGEALDCSGEGEVLRRGHFRYFLNLAEEAEPELRGPHEAEWLERLAAEHDNLRAALGRDGAAPKLLEGDELFRLAAALGRLWDMRGFYSEGRERLRCLLACEVPPGGSAARLKALRWAASLACRQGDYAAARTLCEEGLEIAQEGGDRQGTASCLHILSSVAVGRSDYRSARQLCERALHLRRELGDRQAVSDSLNNLGLIAQEEGDWAAARALHEETLAIRRQLGDNYGIAFSLGNLGALASSMGEYAAARDLLEESLQIARQLGDRRTMASAISNLGLVALAQGDPTTGRVLQDEALEIYRELGERRAVANTLCNLGEICREQGDHPAARAFLAESLALRRDLGEHWGITMNLEALASLTEAESKVSLQRAERVVRLIAAARTLREAIDVPPPPNLIAEQERALHRARETAGPDRFEAAWSEGRTMTMEQAIECALAEEKTAH